MDCSLVSSLLVYYIYSLLLAGFILSRMCFFLCFVVHASFFHCCNFLAQLMSHCSGSQSLPLPRPDRNSSLTGRSGTHPLLSDSSPIEAESHKPAPSDRSISKPPIFESKRCDPADSDAFDSEDEVMSDEDEAMVDVALAEYPVATFVPFQQTAPSNPIPGIRSAVPGTYFLRPPYHTVPLAPESPLGFLCSGQPTELIHPCPLTYSPGPPLDDGDVSSVSQSASQVPPRASSSSESESADPNGVTSQTEVPLPAEPNGTSAPDPTTSDRSPHYTPTV